MESPFFYFFKYWPKHSKKKFRIEIWTFSFQICFKNYFRLREVVKLEIHVYTNTCIFSLTTSRSQKLIFKADLKWECPYFYSKFFCGAFPAVFKKVKKWISNCIFKMWFGRGRVTFLAKKNSEKAKLPQICISFGGSMPIAQIKRCHLTPPSIRGLHLEPSEQADQPYILFLSNQEKISMSGETNKNMVQDFKHKQNHLIREG